MERSWWTILLMACVLKFIVDRIVWISLILIVCAVLGFVVHQCWKKMRNRIGQESEWTKLRGGETMRSFRVWLDCEYCREKSFDSFCHVTVRQPLPMDGDWSRCGDESDSRSILLEIDREIPNSVINGARETILRRYSLLTSDVYSDILRIRYVEHPSPMIPSWRLQSSSFVGRGIVDIVFARPHHLPRETVVLVDMHRRTWTKVKLAAPHGIRLALRSYRDEEQMNRLIILYLIEDWDGYTIRFEVVEHEIELVRRRSKLHARHTHTVVIPVVGNLKLGNYRGLSLSRRGTYFLNGNTIAESKVITFDRKFNATIRPLVEFLSAFIARPIGQRVLAAVNDFVAMLPSEAERRLAFLFMCDSDMVLGVSGDVFALRYVRPPSMLFQTAAMICRLRANADHSELKDEIGFDVFDEIFEEKENPMINIKM